MSPPKSRLAYTDCFETFERALASAKGIRLPFNTYAEAKSFQLRMNAARAVDRHENAMVYPKGDVMHGQSNFDILTVRIVGPIEDPMAPSGETTFVYIEPREKGTPEIEDLAEIEGDGK